MEAAPASIPAARERWIVFLVAVGHGLAHFYLLILPPLYPVVSRDLGLSYAQLGAIFSAAALSMGISQLIVGILSDRIGRKVLLVGGQILMSIAVTGVGLVHTFGGVLLLQIIGGASASVMHPVAVALINDIVPGHRQGNALGMHGTGAQIGNAMAPVLMVSLSLAFGWRTAMLAAGSVGVMLAVLMSGALPSYGAPRPRLKTKTAPNISHALPFGTAGMILALLIWVSRGVCARAYQSFLPVFLIDQFDFSLEKSSVFVSSYWLFAALASMAGGYLADRFNRYAVLWLSSFLAMITLALLIFPPSLPAVAVYADFFLMGFFSFLGRPAFFGVYSEGFTKNSSGTLYAIGFTTAYTLSAGIPGAMGWLNDRYGTGVAFYPVLAVMFLPLVVIPVLRRVRNAFRSLSPVQFDKAYRL